MKSSVSAFLATALAWIASSQAALPVIRVSENEEHRDPSTDVRKRNIYTHHNKEHSQVNSPKKKHPAISIRDEQDTTAVE